MSYSVRLSHASNPDVMGGYWSYQRPPKKKVDVQTLEEASKLCREYLDNNELGSGNWTGGQVFKDKKQVALISYNGRVWAMDGSEIKLTKSS